MSNWNNPNQGGYPQPGYPSQQYPPYPGAPGYPPQQPGYPSAPPQGYPYGQPAYPGGDQGYPGAPQPGFVPQPAGPYGGHDPIQEQGEAMPFSHRAGWC